MGNSRVGADCFLLQIAHSAVTELGADDVGQQVEVEEGTLDA